MVSRSHRVWRAVMVIALIAAAAQAEGSPDPASVIAARRAQLKQLGEVFKRLNDELRKDTPSQKIILANARTMNDIGQQLPTWFPAGTGPGGTARTRARPEIWSDATGFAAAAKTFQLEAAGLSATRGRLDVALLRTQARSAGTACKSCHDRYRLKVDD